MGLNARIKWCKKTHKIVVLALVIQKNHAIFASQTCQIHGINIDGAADVGHQPLTC